MFRRLLSAFRRPANALDRAKALARRGEHTKAFPLLVNAARAGVAEAARLAGECYLQGDGVPANGRQGLRWLHVAADLGDPDAQTRLAAFALQGVCDRPGGLFGTSGGKPDYAQAAAWCRRADTPEAMALLAFILTEGPEPMRDPAAGEALYRRSAEAGWPNGQLGLAVLLLARGDPAGRPLLERAAAGGLAAADYLLGMLAEGDGAMAEAAERYRRAGEAGSVPGQRRLGFALLAGRGVRQDAFQAETWMRKAALAGDAPAAAVVGFLYVRAGNPVEAASWLRRAAEHGHPAAARTLGYLLAKSDPAEAGQWLQAAARAGDAEASRLLHALAPLQTAG